MKRIETSLPTGLGDLLYFKGAFDAIKSQCQYIKLNFSRTTVKAAGRDVSYNDFLNDIGKLLFNEPPYQLDDIDRPIREYNRVYSDFGIKPVKPNLKHIMCVGNPLQIDSPYIVINTKTRYFPKNTFNNISLEFWNVMKQLTGKYKLVVMGEREVEYNKEYVTHADNIYSLYDHIIANIPAERIVDLTIPALGISSPNLKHIQQDALIMRDAAFIVTLGVGGAFALSTSVGNVIGYRVDDEIIADAVFSHPHHDAFVTKNFQVFVNKLRERL